MRIVAVLLLRCVLLCLLVAAGAAARAQAPVGALPLVVALDDKLPPLAFRDESGQLRGILPDLWALWSERTGVPVDLRGQDMGSAQQQVIEGRADVIDGLTITDERRERFDFSPPYIPIPVRLFFDQSISGIVDAASTKGFVVGVRGDGGCGRLLREAGSAQVQRFESYEDMVAAALAGQLHIFCIPEVQGRYLLNRSGRAEEFRFSPPLYTAQGHWAVRKGDQAGYERIAAGFELITPQERRRIEHLWRGEPVGQQPQPFLQLVLVLVLICGLLLLGWIGVLAVTVRRKNATLARQQTDLSVLLQNVPDIVWFKDLSGVYRDCNVLFEELVGRPREQIIGRNDTELFDATLAAELQQHDRDSLTLGRIVHDQRLPGPEGERQLEIVSAPLRNAQGRPFGVLGVGRDLTELRRIHEQVVASEKRYADALDATGEGLWDWHIPSNRATHNPQWYRLLGAEPYGIASTKEAFVERLHPEDRDRVQQAFMAALQGETEVYQSEHRMLRLDGRVIWVIDRGRLVETDSRGRPLRMVGSFTDITARKSIELALQDNERRLQRVLEGSDQIFWDWDLLTDNINVSPRLEQQLGYGPGEFDPSPSRWGEYVHADDLPGLRAEIGAHQTGQLSMVQVEVRLLSRAGHWIWFMVRGGIVQRDADARPLTMSGTLTDISSRKQMALALRDKERRLERVIEGSDQGFWDWNLQSNAFDVSDRFETMLGYEPGTLDLRLENWPALVHPDDLARSRIAIERHVKGELPVMEVDLRCLRADGSWHWVRSRGRVVEFDAAGQPLIMSGTHTDIHAEKLAAEQIEQLAFYDPLTQLPNRRLLLDRLRQALVGSARHGRHGALLLLDLDNFQLLNDALGHEVGDQLLQRVAERLKHCIRRGDTVARLGGDEFVILLDDLDETELAVLQVERIVSKVRSELGRPFALQLGDGVLPERRHQCSTSMGIALFQGDGVSAEELLKRADTALYQAKASGRDAWRFFDPHMQSMVAARADLEEALRQGLQEEQFQLHYQGQVDAEGYPTGAEVLLRWQHPQRGMVSPAEFIPLAEETGLIVPLGAWVLQRACAQLVAWAARPQTAALCIAVNVSARQFNAPGFVDQLLALLDSSGAPPQRLKLELTESMMVANAEEVIARMTQLKARGVRFSLDDFGTGYSSLSYLKRMPFDQLKIDQSFVRDVLSDPNDAAIARTIVALGQSLGLEVIAEGVESSAQRDLLQVLGCRHYQGYLYHRPLPLEVFERWLDEQPHALH